VYGHVSAVGSLLGLRGGVARIPLLLLIPFIVLAAGQRVAAPRQEATGAKP
jgi:hypothetical protein